MAYLSIIYKLMVIIAEMVFYYSFYLFIDIRICECYGAVISCEERIKTQCSRTQVLTMSSLRYLPLNYWSRKECLRDRRT